MLKHSLRPRRALLAGALLSFCALSAAMPAQSGATGGDDVVRWLPPSTIVHLEINGGPCHRDGKNLALAQIWAEPEVQQFFKGALGMLEGMRPLGMMQLQSMGFPPEVVDALMGGRLTGSWCGQIHGQNQDGTDRWDIPDAIFTWDYPENPEAIGAVMGALENLAVSSQVAQFSDDTIEGLKVRRMQLQGMGFPLFYVVDGDGMIFASSRDTLTGCLARRKSGGAGGLGAQAGFRQSWSNTHRNDSAVFAYVDIATLLKVMVETGMVPGEMAMVQQFIPYTSFAFGEDLDGAGLWDRMYLAMPPNNALRPVLATRDRLRLPEQVPANTGFYCGWTLSYTGLLDWVLNIAETVEPGTRAQAEQHFAEAQTHMGFHPREDLLAKMGPEAALFLSFPEHGLIPDVNLLLESPDPAGLQASLEKMMQFMFKGAQMRVVKFGQDSIHYMELARSEHWRREMDAFALRPSWVALDHQILISLWPQSAKNYLANLRGNGPKLAQNADFAALAGRPSSAPAGMQAQSLSYLDLRSLVGFALDNASPGMQSFTPALPPQVPVDIGNWPRTEVITKHLFGVYTRRGLTADGLYSETYSPTGMVLPMGLILGGAGAAFVQMRQSHMQMEMEMQQMAAPSEQHGEF